MGIIKTKGIVLLESNMGDFDKMVSILTPDIGKIGCAAKGARKPKSPLLAGTQFLSFSDLVIFSGANSYNINSCEAIEVFYNIRTDLEKLTYASFISRIVYDVTDENQYTYKILQLLLNTLYMISETDVDKDFILSVFELRLMVLLGFLPQLGKCSICNCKENIAYFSIANNGFLCNSCGRSDKSAIKITQDTFNALKYICTAPAKKIFSFTVSEEAKKELKLIGELYLNKNLDADYKLKKLF
ncbi:MAG: DNA repair protein RecO [Clostridia bacterium]